jgi:hypothetical protein
MIPTVEADLDAMIAEVERQTAEVDELLGGLSEEAQRWRPNETRWSALGHVAHLCLVNRPYLEVLQARLDEAHALGRPLGGEPYRHPWMGRWFARSLEPPPKRRFKTMSSMVPDPGLGPREILPDFRALQTDLARLLESAKGADLGKIRFGSPFFALLRLSAGTAFATILAHNRRHIWLIREVLDQRGEAGASEPRPEG